VWILQPGRVTRPFGLPLLSQKDPLGNLEHEMYLSLSCGQVDACDWPNIPFRVETTARACLRSLRSKGSPTKISLSIRTFPGAIGIVGCFWRTLTISRGYVACIEEVEVAKTGVD